MSNEINHPSITDYEGWIQAAGPHSRLGKFYRTVVSGLQEEIRLAHVDWDNFIDITVNSQIPPITVPEEQKDLFFNLVKGTMYRQFRNTSGQVALKGRALPIGVQDPSFYGESIVDKGESGNEWNDIGIHSYITPQPLIVNGQKLGDTLARVFLHNGTRGVSFYLLSDNRVACGNDDCQDSEIIIDSRQKLYEPLAGSKLFSVGCAADWIGFIVDHNLLDQLDSKLDQMPLGDRVPSFNLTDGKFV